MKPIVAVDLLDTIRRLTAAAHEAA